MPSATIKERSETDEKNIAFYNGIAGNYDTILDDDSSNEIVRKRVKEKFISIVDGRRVLDFGGGTGRDLEWLLNNKYEVVFCEPSEGMRKKAINQYKNNTLTNHITFLENDKVDFTNWHVEPPVPIKVDAILSDFAVINCIADIDLLFKNLALVIKPGGHFIALMLNHEYKKTWRWKLGEFLRSFFSHKPVMKNIQYKEYQQTVYVYSPRHIKEASATYFDMLSKEPLFEFILIHFIRK
jgi:SAM-dependent methyltransferase